MIKSVTGRTAVGLALPVRFSKHDVYIGRSVVKVICGYVTISMLWDNTAYCAKLSGEDLCVIRIKLNQLVYENLSCYRYLTKKVMSQ